MYSEAFYISIATICGGLITLIIKYLLRSKCSNVNLCFGLININRDIEAEVKEELEIIHQENNNHNSQNTSPSNLNKQMSRFNIST